MGAWLGVVRQTCWVRVNLQVQAKLPKVFLLAQPQPPVQTRLHG